MMGMLVKVGRYVLARLEERSTVAGLVGVVLAACGMVLPVGQVATIVNAVVMVASAVAMAVPAGK